MYTFTYSSRLLVMSIHFIVVIMSTVDSDTHIMEMKKSQPMQINNQIGNQVAM